VGPSPPQQSQSAQRDALSSILSLGYDDNLRGSVADSLGLDLRYFPTSTSSLQ
jgi:hypothetical protein